METSYQECALGQSLKKALDEMCELNGELGALDEESAESLKAHCFKIFDEVSESCVVSSCNCGTLAVLLITGNGQGICQHN